MSQFTPAEQSRMRPSQPTPQQPPRTRNTSRRRLGPAEAIVAAFVDMIAIAAPPILTHALLEWTVLAWIVAAQIVVLLALFLATVGRTPGLMLVSAVVIRPPTGTPNVGQALARVILTPLLPLQRRIIPLEGDSGTVVTTPGPATAEKTTVLDVLTRTSTTTSRPAPLPAAQATDPQNSRATSATPGLDASATPTTPVHGAGAYAPAAAPAATAYAPPAGPTYEAQGPSSGVAPAPAPPRTQLPRSFPPVGPGAPGPTAAPIPTPGAPATAPFPTSANAPNDGEAASPRPSAPPLYRIVINSTRRLPLEGQCVLGREPRALMPQDVQLVTLDASTSVSRSHLRVGVAGAGPWAEDLGSANGSVLLRPDGTQTPLTPGIRTPLGPGGAVLLAEGVHLAVEASRRARRAQQSA